MFRYYEDGEYEKVYKIFSEGGKLYFIKRTDTNQFFNQPMEIGLVHQHYEPDHFERWADTIKEVCGVFNHSAFLTRESAEKQNKNFTKGGCRHCGHGSEPIPAIVIEHEFEKED